MIFLVTFATFLSTFVGGVVALRYRDKLHLILGFTAGVLLSVVVFDILPEIFQLVQELKVSTQGALIALVLGFLIFHIFEKLLLIHRSQEEEYGLHKHPTVGVFSALALAGHSFLDGVGIGLGFQVSPQVGILVAIAIIAHDFSDGLNTVSLVLNHKNSDKKALYLLLIDAIAPVFGVISTFFYKVPAELLVLYLGFFAGFLLYIGASEILPEAHSEHSSVLTLVMTVLGVAFIFLVTRFV